ncbi:MurR/RpiR family transcriptional regulator [Streptomyces umbrinus]|uniref:MurR/RpiR family transcriptional regulator n=1 Tax=Streptomyces umbrinus TaxID=67370 RepID=UPI00359448D4
MCVDGPVTPGGESDRTGNESGTRAAGRGTRVTDTEGAGVGVDAPQGAVEPARLHQLFEGRRLTPTQRRIAHCLVRQTAAAPFLSSVELAQLAGVSQPSVTRFAVALGFDGYPALRRHLRDVAPAGPSVDARPANPYQQAVRAEIHHLLQLASLLADAGPVERAGRLLAASRPLPVLGLRASAAQARGFAYFAAKVHPDVRLLDEGGSRLADRIDMAKNAGASALMCFALPRHPAELLDALDHARATGLTVVTIADGTFAPVAAHSDLLLPAAVGTDLVFDTVSAPMLLGQVLLEAMCDALPDAQARLEEFDTRAAARGLFVD